MNEITLDRKTFEALAIDTRVDILKSLKQRRKTQAELSKELHLAASTVSEHLDKMLKAELVSRQSQGKKWIYYELTEKGRSIVEPRKASVFIFALSLSLILMFAGLFLFSYSSSAGITASEKPDVIRGDFEEMMTAGVFSDELPKEDSMEIQHEFISREKTGALLIGIGILVLMTAFKLRKK